MHGPLENSCIFFEAFQSDFTDFYVNKKTTLRKKLSFFFIFDMPTIPKNLRECAIGTLNADMTMNAVAMNIGWFIRAIRHRRQLFSSNRAYGRSTT